MDLETFIALLRQYFVDSGNLYFVLYAVATCLLSQLCKKIFVNKAKVDVMHKFDFAVIFPFIFGLVFAVIDVYLVHGVRIFDFSIVLRIVLQSVTIGAFASTIFKAVKSLFGQSLSSLMKNDVFGVIYTQLLYFGTFREQLANKTLTMSDFIAQVKLLAEHAESIYKSEDSAEVKRCQLAKLLNGIIDEQSINSCIYALNEALINYTTKK